MVDLASGIVSTVAGNGTMGFSGDGGAPVACSIVRMTTVVDGGSLTAVFKMK